MKCPRCENNILEERERDGVMIDVCRSCRGIWLDRGELEKLIARSGQELDDLERQYARPHDHDKNHHEHSRDRRYPHAPRRKRHWLESLSDIFD